VNNDLETYFQSATGERSTRAMAQRAGLTQSTVSRQLRGENALTVQTVVALCRAYSLNYADVFVEVGFLTEEEAKNFSGPARLADVPEQDLLVEMLRRVNEGTASRAATTPLDEGVLDDVLRSVEDARENGKQSDYGTAANGRPDRTPGELESDDTDRSGL
jgi:transcriptional regulator with XRE-family HTH domain